MYEKSSSTPRRYQKTTEDIYIPKRAYLTLVISILNIHILYISVEKVSYGFNILETFRWGLNGIPCCWIMYREIPKAVVVNSNSFGFEVFPLILITMQIYLLNCIGLSFMAENKTPEN